MAVGTLTSIATNAVIVLVASCGLLAYPAEDRLPRDRYVGDQICVSCHDAQASYLRTAHSLTSRLPSKDTVLGNFSPNKNLLRTSNPDLLYRMDATAEGLYETAVIGVEPDATSRREKIDLVIGSGRKGQTYAFWRGSGLYELPVSYWTEIDQWVNSPGYRDDFADFSRPISARCVECHAGYFEAQVAPAPSNFFNRTNFVLGISCERCHGPGRDHVQHHKAKAQSTKAGTEAIVNPAKLDRARQLDACALCHGGIGAAPLAPAFSYIPGARLDEYIRLEHPDPEAPIDVHGNQVALLERSRCFQSSGMTCSTCHDLHRQQRDAASFSAHCLTCHKPESCGMFSSLGQKIAQNCVDCHMPRQPSNAIISDANGTKLRPLVRTHWIRIYPAESSSGMHK